MAPKFKFSDGEKVLCFHGPLLYEAKCIKSQFKEKHVKYFIHYSGWNKNWDEWVPESRVLKYNDGNVQRQKELQLAHGQVRKAKNIKGSSKKDAVDRESSALPIQERTSKQKVAAAVTPTAESQSELQRKKRTRAEMNVETEDEFVRRMEIKVKIPDELKHWLVEDWDYINRQKKFLVLPARVSVDALIDDYVKQRTSVKGITANKEAAIMEATNGIKEYFRALLSKQLLYKCERSQFSQLIADHPEKTLTQIYGGIHLLRMFTKIGAILAYTPLEEDSINLLLSHFHDFVKYLSKTSSLLFHQTDYISLSPDQAKKTA